MQKHERELLERLVFFQNLDKGSESFAQVTGVLVGSDGGLLLSWLLLDAIDNIAVPSQGLKDVFGISWLAGIGERIGSGRRGLFEAAGAAPPFDWANLTEEQKQEAAPLRVGISKGAKRAKAAIIAYFIMQHGDDWLDGIGAIIDGFVPS
jgi:hypothetical protein